MSWADATDRKKSEYWKRLSVLRQTKIFLEDYNRRRFDDKIIGRNGLRVLLGFFSGHFKLKEKLFRLGLVDIGVC